VAQFHDRYMMMMMMMMDSILEDQNFWAEWQQACPEYGVLLI